jgi:DNA polymerase
MSDLTFDGTWDGWRPVARAAINAGLAPERTNWCAHAESQTSMFATAAPIAPDVNPVPFTVPKEFLTLGTDVARHRDATRWNLLYRVLWRLLHGERHLLEVYVDDDVHRLCLMAKAVRREGHKMRAFVRFRLTAEGTPRERYVAWFEPEHDVVSREAHFFATRFPSMCWSILTPTISAHWDLADLTYGPGLACSDAPDGDDTEALWRTYYASTFNPARTKPAMMRSEMPERYWKNLPEAALIAPLLRDAPGRVARMVAREEAVVHTGRDDNRAATS